MIVQKILRNKKNENYNIIVPDFFKHVQHMEVNMSLKIHFLDTLLSFFLENVGSKTSIISETDLGNFKKKAKISHFKLFLIIYYLFINK